MTMTMHLTKNASRWNGVVLAIIVAVVVHLTAITTAQTDEPWPMLLPNNSADSDPTVTLLQQRANGSLEKLVQSARAAEEL